MSGYLGSLIVLLQVTSASTQPQPARPVDPIATIVAAFRTHDIVTLTDPHGNVQMQHSCCRRFAIHGFQKR